MFALENLLQENIFTKQVEREMESGCARAGLAPWAPHCLCGSKGRGQSLCLQEVWRVLSGQGEELGQL